MNITSILFPEHQHCVVRTREAFDNASDGMGLAPHDVCDQQRSKLTILVILHYLLKNNITFMGGILQGKSGGGSSLQSRVLLTGPSPTIGGSFR
jgi:hypothetical protein